jgi:4'-phosphopantetheinyl transferase
VLAQEVLGRALGVAPDSLEFSRVCTRCGDPRHGKPELKGGELAFNVSHSGEIALIAIAPAGRVVGVDVEEVRARALDLEKLAVRTMSTGELDDWRRVPDDKRLAAFLECWTAKEAYLKAIGVGIATDLRAVTLPDDWSCVSIAVPAGYVASLAVDAADVAVSFEEWRN